MQYAFDWLPKTYWLLWQRFSVMFSIWKVKTINVREGGIFLADIFFIKRAACYGS